MIRVKWPALVIVFVVLAFAGGLLITRGNAAQVSGPALLGTQLTPSIAPDFRLSDQFGRPTAVSALRGHTLALTFVEAHCTQLCSTVTEKVRRVLAEIGPAGKTIDVIAVSTDPQGDTPAAVRQFSRQHGMYHRWHYVAGTRRQLAPIWRAYYVYAAPANAPPKLRDAHSSATYLIDRAGRERIFLGGDPPTAVLDTDLRLLAGIPARGTAELAVAAPEMLHPAPAFTVTDLRGRRVSLHSFPGKSVLLNFWATWCRPCRSEMPLLERWAGAHRSQVVVLGVDQQEDSATVSKFVRDLRVSYPVALDQSGEVSARFDVAGLPKSLLIDARGTVRGVKLGELTGTELAHFARLGAGRH